MIAAFVAAIAFLTRLPVPRRRLDAEAFARAIRCYPAAGLIVGAIVALAGAAAVRIDQWTGALGALVAWVAVTGALHLDGLGDVADGLGAAHGDRARLLAVMADPHVGSFGVVAIAVQLIAKLILLHAAAAGAWWPIAIVPAAARIGPIAWAYALPPMKPGLGARVASAARRRDLVGWLALLTVPAIACPALLAAPVLIAGYALWVRAGLGGISGDAHGAGIEIVETGLLLAIAAAGAG